jgi:hypothetical protein
MSEKRQRINVEMTDGMSSMTPQASLIFTERFFEQSGLSRVIDESVGARDGRGASDSDHIKALVMTQICGGDAIEHLKHLRCRVEALGIKVPSTSASRSYAQEFHNAGEDSKRGAGHSFIPAENGHLSGFSRIHAHLFKVAYDLCPKESITLDQDATLIPTGRAEAFFCYKGMKANEAFNTFCPEYDLMAGTRYSDGNVPAGYRQLEELKRVLSYVPEGVKKVSLRSDSAGYQTGLIKYCAGGGNERFGVIDFGISCDVGVEFKDAARRVPEKEWRPLLRHGETEYTQEWAEVVYVPGSLSRPANAPEIRFFAMREIFSQSKPVGNKAQAGSVQKELGFQMDEPHIKELESGNDSMKRLHLTLMSGKIYKVFGLASNITDKAGDEIILWHRGRCGKSEQAHDILKNDFGGGHVPSHLFGVNAAWWNISVLAMNVSSLLKTYFLPEGYENVRMKTLRNIFYTLAGKVVRHARRISLKIHSLDAGAELLMYALRKLDELLPCPT